MKTCEPRLVPVLRIADGRGVLGVAEYPVHVPFPVVRVFSIVGVPEGADRGGHAHRTLEEFLLVPIGRVTVRAVWSGGTVEAIIDTPSTGFYLPPMSWLELSEFAEGTVVVVLASASYDESDYVRDRAEYDRTLMRMAAIREEVADG